MHIKQYSITLPTYKRGFHIITSEIENAIPEISDITLRFAHIFIKHTSASLTINENIDTTVRTDMENHFNCLVPEKLDWYSHTQEGLDDMTAHIKSSLLGSDVTIPITNGSFNLGLWQGMYLCEHRNSVSNRTVVITVYGEYKN